MSLSYTFKSLAAFLFVLFWGWELSAVPSYPRPIRVEQPDGTTMTVRLYGDERFNYVTTVDGYNLVAENGVLYYAQVQGTKLVSTGVQAHDPMNRTNEERRILSSVSFGYPPGVAALISAPPRWSRLPRWWPMRAAAWLSELLPCWRTICISGRRRPVRIRGRSSGRS